LSRSSDYGPIQLLSLGAPRLASRLVAAEPGFSINDGG
jgi:hypothetical protein